MRWCAAGFVAGAIFWHAIGFWSFMSYLVLGPPEGPETVARSGGLEAAQNVEERIERLTERRVPAPCSALVLDRNLGVTRLAPCVADGPPAQDKPVAMRGDRVQPPDIARASPQPVWSAEIDPSTAKLVWSQ